MSMPLERPEPRRRRRPVRLWAARLIAAAACWFSAIAQAQDLEPRAYSNSPVGLHFLLGGYGYSTGSILTDPSLPIEDLNIDVHGGVLAFATTFAVLGQSAKADFVLPYASLSATGLVSGEPRERHVTGFGDPLIRLSMNFIGAPALTAAEFGDYQQDWIVGGSLRIGIPLGQYDNTRLINIGANRWSIRPELGVSKAIGSWTIELAPGVAFYTGNDDFFGGNHREQEPLFGLQSHFTYNFGAGFWAAFDAAWFSGGQSMVNGARNEDRAEGARLGLTVALPVNKHHSLKLYAVTGFNARWGRDFDALGVAWQYRWGGGF